MVPYLIVGTPRTRTAWLAKFLSTPDRRCVHEPSLRWNHPSDLVDFLSDDAAAASDSMMTFFANRARELRPDIKIVVVRRHLPDVRASLARLGLIVPNAYLDMIDRKARAVEADMMFTFDELNHRSVVRAIAEACVGRFDNDKWELMRHENVQSNAQETIKLLAERNDVHAKLYGPYYD